MRSNARLVVTLTALLGCNPTAPAFDLLVAPPPVDAGPAPRDGGTIQPPPPPPPPPPPTRDGGIAGPNADGDACLRSEECQSGFCLRRGAFPGGYCTIRDCESDAECNRPDGVCILEFGMRFCAGICGGNGTCRDAYTCVERNNLDVCLPLGPEEQVPDGSACTANNQCLGGTCLRAPAWPGGFCTTVDCEAGRRCSGAPDRDAVCTPGLGPAEDTIDSMCSIACERYSDCREDYACVSFGPGARLCMPDNAPPPALDPPGSYPFDLTCGFTSDSGVLAFDYVVPPGTTSYGLTVLSRDGRQITPMSINGPGGLSLDLNGNNFLYARTGALLGNVSPSLFPLTPVDSGFVRPGVHTYSLETNSNDVCYYVLDEPRPGARLDINLYFVGASGVNAATAPNNADIAEFLTELGTILAGGGVIRGQTRFFDVSAAARNRHRIIRDIDQVNELGLESQRPGDALDARLSINVFMINRFEIPDLSPAGVSPGVPGVMGIHDVLGAGVVMQSELLGVVGQLPDGSIFRGNEYLAIVMAHEMGHFLGLFHTTSFDGDPDPLPDTPVCAVQNFPDNCPDIGNVMFPQGLPGNVSFTPNQGYVLGANPLTKE